MQRQKCNSSCSQGVYILLGETYMHRMYIEKKLHNKYEAVYERRVLGREAAA